MKIWGKLLNAEEQEELQYLQNHTVITVEQNHPT